jgi:hypothetical protein
MPEPTYDQWRATGNGDPDVDPRETARLAREHVDNLLDHIRSLERIIQVAGPASMGSVEASKMLAWYEQALAKLEENVRATYGANLEKLWGISKPFLPPPAEPPQGDG